MSRDAGRQRNPSLPVQAPAVSAVSREPALPTPAPPWDQDSVSREMKTRYKSFPCRLPEILGDCAALPVAPRAWSPSEPLLKCPVPWTRRQGGHLSSSPSEKVATAGGAHTPGVPVLDSEPPGRAGQLVASWREDLGRQAAWPWPPGTAADPHTGPPASQAGSGSSGQWSGPGTEGRGPRPGRLSPECLSQRGPGGNRTGW